MHMPAYFRHFQPILPIPACEYASCIFSSFQFLIYLLWLHPDPTSAEVEELRKVLLSLNAEDAVSISKRQDLQPNRILKTQLVYVSTYYKSIPDLITRLESSSLSIDVSLNNLETVKTCCESATGPKAGPVREKLKSDLRNNPGFSTF